MTSPTIGATGFGRPQLAVPASVDDGPKQRILSAATTLFFQQGFPATSVREITSACDLTPGALYNHFPSKEAVLYALIVDATEIGERMMAEARRLASPDPASQLYALTYASALYHTRHREAGMIGLLEYRRLAEPELSVIVARRHALREQFETVIREGADAGAFQLPVDASGKAHQRAASAVINVAIRVTDAFGPDARVEPTALAEFQSQLALRMVTPG